MKPLIFQYRIYRSDLRNNPDMVYVFGDNVVRKGFGGQAGEMRGEPNAIGVATKWYPGKSDLDYFTPDRVTRQIQVLAEDMSNVVEAMKSGKMIVWPTDGVGTGLSDLPNRCPESWEFLVSQQKVLVDLADQIERSI